MLIKEKTIVIADIHTYHATVNTFLRKNLSFLYPKIPPTNTKPIHNSSPVLNYNRNNRIKDYNKTQQFSHKQHKYIYAHGNMFQFFIEPLTDLRITRNKKITTAKTLRRILSYVKKVHNERINTSVCVGCLGVLRIECLCNTT